MQRVSSFLPSWDRRSSSGRGSGLLGWPNRSSTSPNSLAKINTAAANAAGPRVRRETFWPAALDLECDKAARILKSFCADGCLAPLYDETQPSSPASAGPRTPVRVTKKIPKRILQNAAGIAVFTCMRSGLWMTGSGGSGILIARKSDGTWSPPSGIMLHTPTLSFIIGIDVYDCVLVINNLAALESITRSRVILGEDIGMTSGPLVPLDSNELEIKWKDLGNTVLTYMKARGQTQTVNLNGCILTERGNENERFYASDVTQMDILAGNVSRHVDETKPLFEVIKMAEGRTDFDASVIDKIATEPAPGDAMIASPRSTPASPRTAFGRPNIDDPDPFGILALEMAGLEIREAGSRLRPTSSQLDFNIAPMSPAFPKFNRQSVDTVNSKSNRGSYMSTRTVRSQVTDAGTQTDTGNTPETTPSPGQSEDGLERVSIDHIPVVREEEVDYTTVDMTPLKHISQSHSSARPDELTDSATTMRQDDTTLKPPPAISDAESASKTFSNYDKEDQEDFDDDTNDADDEDDELDEEPVVFEVAAVQPARTQAVASRVIHAKGSMVTIPKRIPPPLPTRSPARNSRSSKSEIGDVTGLKSPLRQTFSEADLAAEDAERQRTSVAQAQDAKIERSEAEAIKIESTEMQGSPPPVPARRRIVSLDAISDRMSDPHQEQADNSDSHSNKKHTSSVFTGATEDRWSMDGSSVTTPTSERPFSAADDVMSDETPKKQKEMEKEIEKQVDDEIQQGRVEVESKETAPNNVTVA